MKRFVFSLIVVYSFCFMFGMFGQVSAASSPTLFLDGKQIATDVDPVITKGTTLVPLAVISSQLGYEVHWNNELREVNIKNQSTEISLTIGNKIALVNNESYEILEAPFLLNNRTMVPIRFIAEVFGMKVDWKQSVSEVHITRPIVIAPDPEPSVTEKTTVINVYNENDATIHIEFTGEVSNPKVMELQNPRRVVVDFADTGFSPEIVNSFIQGKTEVSLEGYDFITKYRYSIFTADPLVARFVVELQDNTKYSLLQTENDVRITFSVPSDDDSEGEPTSPEDPVIIPPIDTKKVYHIVLDAGHGAKDPGAISKINGKKEKDFNLSAVLKLKAELDKHPQIKVHLTRSDDTFLELDERVAFAEKIPGVNVKADVFISIHANSFDNSTANGTETYYIRDNSKKLAETIHPHLIAGTGLTNRGVKTAGFKVIKATTMPAVLLEVGYMSNEKDVKALFDESVQQKLAQELTKGIKAYLNLQ